MRRLTALFPSEFLEEHAEELGVLKREGKLQIPVLVCALVVKRGDGYPVISSPRLLLKSCTRFNFGRNNTNFLTENQ
jgi:hypothetical protein